MTLDFVKKRDAKKVEFKAGKIKSAVAKAAAAVDQENEEVAEEITAEVLSYLKIFFKDGGTVEVEQIQDLVEKILIEKGYAEIAKAYILYREQHSKLRDSKKLFADAVNIMDDYLDRSDWKVNENSNMSYSLQGLNNFIASEVTGQYWLQEIYTDQIAELHSSGDLHIHDLGNLSVYCCGWDLEELLRTGFRGVPTKIESAPPKHLKTALGQIVNFMYTLQGECYSADTEILTEEGWKYFYDLNERDKVCTINPETDKIEYQKPLRYIEKDYDGKMLYFSQRSLDMMVTPDHKLLVEQYAPHTEDNYYKKFVLAKDFNSNNNFIPKQGNWEAEKKEYFVLPPLKTVVYQFFGDNYVEKMLEVPKIKMNIWLAFFGFWIAEGSAHERKRKMENRSNYSEYIITITQNENQNAAELKKVLAELPFEYHISRSRRVNGPDKLNFRINSKQLYNYLKKFGHAGDKYIPKKIKALDKSQLEILFNWMMKGDGYIGNGNYEYYTKSKKLADDVQEIMIKLGYCANIYIKTKGKFKWYVISRLATKMHKVAAKNINEIEYSGKVYCVEVPNQTLLVRRNGKSVWGGNCAGAQAFSNFDTYLAPFIAYDDLDYEEVKQAVQEFLFNMNVPTRVGFQSPFTNITMDLEVPDYLKEQAVIIGGEYQQKAYGEFQQEMDMFNRAFAELMMEGDSKGRMFSFPIPTYNITKDFEWENEKLNPVWEMTAKFGIPYFSNFVNSDMNPEDARSMAILGAQEVIYKNQNGDVAKNEIRHLVNNWIEAPENNKPEYKMLMNGAFVDVIDMFEVPYEDYSTYVNIELENNYKQSFSYEHKCAVVRNGEFKEIESQDLLVGDKFIVSKNGYNESSIGNYKSGKVLGYYLGEGWINNHSKGEICFSININREDIVNKLKDYFNKIACKVKIEKINEDNVYNINVYGKQAVGFVKNYIRGKKATTKRLNNSVWNTSIEFRKGIVDGLYETDGHKKNNTLFHTTNKKLAKDLITLVNTIGKTLKYRENDKNTRYFKEDKSDKETFTSYELKFKDDYNTFELDGSNYDLVEITNVRQIGTKTDTVYNFTVDTERHLYELPNGIITHQCCRLRLDNKELRKRGGGLFGANPMTGSIGVVTLNMPRIGYQAQDKEEFMERVYYLMDQAKESLEIKRKVLETLTEQGLYPYAKFYLRDIKNRFDQYWKNHFNTIGLNGMNEALLNFMGKDISTPEGQQFSQEVMEKMRERLQQYQGETDNLYNLEATPAEGTAYRFARLDREKFGDQIIAANQERVIKEDADPYYTNSTQLPVGLTDDIFTALELQDDLQSLYTGGTVLHGFLGEKIDSIEATKKLVKRIAENFKLPYYTLTPSFSICPVHGYLPGEHEYCPKCETESEAREAAAEESEEN